MSKLTVKISPFYAGRGWFDPRSGLNFLKDTGAVEIPAGKDLTNIKRDIRHNALIVVEGSIAEYEAAVTVPETPKVTPEVKIEEPKVEEKTVLEDVVDEVETAAEVKVEAEVVEDKPAEKKPKSKKSAKKE